MAERIQLTIDIGPNAPIEIIREVIDSVDVVCQFADELTFASESRPVREVTGVQRVAATPQDYGRWMPGPTRAASMAGKSSARKAPVRKAAAKKAAAKKGAPRRARIQAPRDPGGFGFRADDGDDDFGPLEITTVESIQYQNPFTIVLEGVALIYLTWALLVNYPRFRRDYAAKQKTNEAVASDVESIVYTRKVLRLYILQQIAEGKLQLTPDQINNLLNLEVAAAYKFLGDQNIDLKQLPSAPAKKPKAPAKK